MILPEPQTSFLPHASDTPPSHSPPSAPRRTRTLTPRISSPSRRNLSGLGLQGTLSDQWGGVTNLVSIDLSGNELFGQVPGSWANLVRLRSLRLARNMLTINVTEVHLMLSNLEALDVSGNVLIKQDIPVDLSQQQL